MSTESGAQSAKQLNWFQHDLVHAISSGQRLTMMIESLESTAKKKSTVESEQQSRKLVF